MQVYFKDVGYAFPNVLNVMLFYAQGEFVAAIQIHLNITE